MGLPGVCASDADCTGGTGPCNLQTLRCTTGNNTMVNTAIANANFVPVPAGIPRLIVHPTTGLGCPLPLQ